MQNDKLLYKLLLSSVMLLLIIAAALPAVMQDNTGRLTPVPNDAFTLTGILESINNQQIVVDGTPIDIRVANLNTRLTLGDMVSVQGSLIQGIFTAQNVNLPDVVTTPEVTTNESSAANNDNFEFRGIVESIDDGFGVISGQRVEIANNIATPLIVGQFVRVKGSVRDGIFAVREIRTPNNEGSFDDDLDDRFDDDDLSIPAGCVVSAPSGWVSYSIRSGDTLSSIASRSGSRVSELVQVNCLSNPRFIVSGTALLLPRVPTSFPTSGGGNESSRSQNSPNNSGGNESSRSQNSSNNSGGSNESSGSRPQPPPSNSGGNESSGSSSGSNS